MYIIGTGLLDNERHLSRNGFKGNTYLLFIWTSKDRKHVGDATPSARDSGLGNYRLQGARLNIRRSYARPTPTEH